MEATEGDPLIEVFPPAVLIGLYARGTLVAEQSERAARSARNELLFRAVNEQIVGMTERFRAQLSDIDVVCECADQTCVGTIRIAAEAFGRIERADEAFLVLPGHEDARIEDVIERNGRYFVVKKRGPAARIIRAVP